MAEDDDYYSYDEDDDYNSYAGDDDSDDYHSIDSEDINLKEWWRSTKTLLGSVDDERVRAFSISIVPDELRKWNENAYVPKVVSMGPQYKGTKRDLLLMEEIKWRCMLSLLHRTDDPIESLHRCMETILRLNEAVRACYVDEIKADKQDLSRMMLLDGCFLLELLITGSKELDERIQSRYPGPGAEVGKMEEVLTDLILLENQIPLLILQMLWDTFHPLFCDDDDDDELLKSKTIKDLALSLFGYTLDSISITAPKAAHHFLEVVHSSIPGLSEKVDKEIHQESQDSSITDHIIVNIEEVEHVSHVHVELLNRCATRLQAAGIRIKPLHTDHSEPMALIRKGIRWLRFSVQRYITRTERRKHVKDDPAVITSLNFDIIFSHSDRKLEIPSLHITKTTEAKWRNFIAWEHHEMKFKSSSVASAGELGTTGFRCKCTSAALLFNGLICGKHDIQLLKDRKVIVDHLNMSNRDLMAIFRSITMGVDPRITDSIYRDMFHALNTYSATTYATQIPTILRHSWLPEIIQRLHKFLRRGYNLAAAIISLCTVLQTVYAVISYHYPKK